MFDVGFMIVDLQKHVGHTLGRFIPQKIASCCCATLVEATRATR